MLNEEHPKKTSLQERHCLKRLLIVLNAVNDVTGNATANCVDVPVDAICNANCTLTSFPVRNTRKAQLATPVPPPLPTAGVVCVHTPFLAPSVTS